MQMKCMNCGAPLGESSYCPNCGFDVVVQKKTYLLSNLYYNQGLEKAEIRDLSGAIDALQRSLKFNKLNIDARNLLGLVYFEMGEAVAALSEWVISNNISPKNNIATSYIARLQESANKLDVINQTIKKYNEALFCCRSGSPDVARIQLKKILSQNPKLIKAYHLLALLYIDNKEYEKARRILRKSVRIDKTNARTLRFLKEVDEQTGTHTNLDSRWGFSRRDKGDGDAFRASEPDVIMPASVREKSMISTVANLGFGVFIGALVVWFLFVPARTQKINGEANRRVAEYSNTMAAQASELEKMKDQITESKETVSSAKEQIKKANSKVDSYENLFKAWKAFSDENYTNAANSMGGVKGEDLSVEAKAIFDDISGNIQTTLFNSYKSQGIQAYNLSDFATAVDEMERARTINESDYEVNNYLAHAYRETGDNDKAIAMFQVIIDQNQGTRRANSAQYYINAIQNGTKLTDIDPSTDASEPQDNSSSSEDDTSYDSEDSGESNDSGDGSDSSDEASSEGE